MKLTNVVLVLTVLALAIPSYGQTCSQLNFSSSPLLYVYNPLGNEEHPYLGDHAIYTNSGYKCTYAGPYNYQGQKLCVPTAQSFAESRIVEDALYGEPRRPDNQPGDHYIDQDRKTQTVTGSLNGTDEPGAAVCWATGGVSCQAADINCTAPVLSTNLTGNPNYACYTSNTPHFGSTGYALPSMTHAWENGPNFCSYLYLGGVSPIVIDRAGDHFQSNFVGLDDKFVWDFYGRFEGNNYTGGPIHMGWTKPGVQVGFLWLDRTDTADRYACFMAPYPRGCNQHPDNGWELFGNITPQQAPVRTSPRNPYKPNGAAALMMYDQKQFGGNGDGKITKEDKVWSHLGVWFDLNHNGKLDPGENFTLDQLGIVALSTNWSESGETDQYGNVKGVEVTVETNNSRPMSGYDVWFVARH